MNRPAPRPRHQAGLSLLELLIAVTLGLLLLGGLLTVYSASSLSYRVAENTNRMQEGARHAFSLLGEHIRSAGYMGCFSSTTGPTRNWAQPAIPFGTATHPYLMGHEAIAAGSHNDDLDTRAAVAGTYSYAVATHGTAAANQGLAGTDALTTRRASVHSMLLNGNAPAAAAPLIPIQSNSLALSDGDYVLVGHCGSTEMVCAQAGIFNGLNASTAPGRCTGNNFSLPSTLLRTYSLNEAPQVRQFEETTFFIHMNPALQPALYWRSRVGGSPQTQELVEGVQDMQLCFGEDTDTPPDRTVNVYRPANAVANWGNVVSVRVTLLMRSVEDGIATAPQAYGIDRNCDDVIDAGETFTPTDRRVRRAFTNTFSVRNRLP